MAIQAPESAGTGASTAYPSAQRAMKLLHSLYAAAVCATVVCGPLASLSPAVAVPISGVKSSSVTASDGGPRRPGAIYNSGGGVGVASGRPMVIPTPTSSPDRLVGMNR